MNINQMAIRPAIQLTPGFTGYVEIKDSNESVLYRRNFNSDQDLKDFIVKYGKSKPGWSLLDGLVRPLRMDSWQHFAEDFFFLLLCIML